MSFFTDLTSGNFGNLWHDVESQVVDHPLETLGYGAAAVGSALSFGALAPELFGGVAALEAGAEGAAAAGGGGMFGGLFGGTEAAIAGGAGTDALLGGVAGDTLGISSGNLAVDSAFSGGAGGLSGGVTPSTAMGTGFEGVVGGEAAPLGGALPPNPVAPMSTGPGTLAGGPTGGGGSFLGDLGAGAMKSITNNPLGTAAAGVGLGMSLLRGNPTDPNQKMLGQQAGELGAQGKILQDYLANGTLPPALKAQLDQATHAAKARIIANHAKNGMPTDPSMNSALAQELNSLEMQAVSSMATAQIDMMKTGLNATGLSSQLYEMMVKMDRQNNQDLMMAITNFASALGGGNKGIQLKAA